MAALGIALGGTVMHYKIVNMLTVNVPLVWKVWSSNLRLAISYTALQVIRQSP